ncbi:adenylate kinase family protein [Halostella salina]|uniref:adenylate kinase family protein n=1 Tax=Halostella salina TaxID=1547897 RepID=UPI000EF8016E|nr:adenylate kinase family protein [Halostella salina]
MRVAVTGTPGTGKTTATDRLDTALDVVHLNDVVREEGLYDDVDEERDSVIVDIDAVADWLGDRDDVVVDSHLAHHLDADRVVVLRCHPEELERRLRDRGEPPAKAEENAESEALDVILAEAVDAHGEANVYEIDATDRDPDAVAAAIEAVVAGEREPSAGTVSFVDYL